MSTKGGRPLQQSTASRDVEWVPSICNFCSTVCNIKVGVKESGGKKRAVKIEGNADSPLNQGKACARGQAGVRQAYDPDRIKTPLIREPGSRRGEWKFREATWEEAFAYIGRRMQEEKIEPWEISMVGGWTSCVFYMPLSVPYVMANGIPNIIASPMQQCVASGHLGTDTVTGNFNIHDEVLADFANAKYMLFAMTNAGVAGISTSRAVRYAKGKKNGAKVVVLDPRRSELAAQADEWLPIRPGTDGAFLLAVMNIILQKNLYDQEFVRKHSNAPFLAFEHQGMVVPMMEMGDPGQPPKTVYVYDEVSKSVKALPGFANDNTVDARGNVLVPALTAPKNLEFNGQKVKTIFDFLKARLSQYTADWAAGETGIPAATIERIALELGMTRPALVDPGWHGARYSNVIYTRRLQAMLQVLLGGIDRPGGWLMAGEYRHKAMNFYKDMAEGRETPAMYRPGLQFAMGLAGIFGNPESWPHKKPGFAWAHAMTERQKGNYSLVFPAMADFGLEEAVNGKLLFNGEPYRIKALMLSASNPVRHFYPEQRWKDILTNENLKLVMCVDVLPSDTAAYADVILPNNNYIERFEPFVYSAGPSTDLAYTTRFRAIDPQVDGKDMGDILFEMSRRRGTLERFIQNINMFTGIPAELLQREIAKAQKGEITYQRAIRNAFMDHEGGKLGMSGEELEKKLYEHGVLVLESAEKLLEHGAMPEKIPVPTPCGRLELYSLMFASFIQDFGYRPEWEPLVTYVPPEPPKHLAEDEFNFIYGKVPTVSYASTNTNNALLMALSKNKEEKFMGVWIHPESSRRLGIKDGDKITLTNTKSGQKAGGRAFVTEMIRPDTVFVASSFGNENPMLHVGSGVGTAIGKIIPYDVEPLVGGFKSQEFTVKISK